MGAWIDTDMGFDDIAAVLTVMAAEMQIDGISLVFGNAPLEQVVANAAGAAKTFGWTMKIHIGRSHSVLGQTVSAESVLGETGMPTLGRSLPKANLPETVSAFSALCRWLETEPEPRILALGPLTNLAALALARPDLAGKIRALVWMGGAVGRGNHTASAEFNACADPEALAIILTHGIPLKMVDLDLCRQVLLTPQDVDDVRRERGEHAGLLADLLGGYVGIGTSRGRAAMAAYDPSAAVAFIDPNALSFMPARIDVELGQGLTRGRTVVETRASHAQFNAEYAERIDPEKARAYILGALCGAAGA